MHLTIEAILGSVTGVAVGMVLFGWHPIEGAVALLVCFVFGRTIGRVVERLIARLLP